MKPYILVVDDEPDIRHLVKDILEDEGYEVSVAENGNAARQQVQARVPDLTLLDIWMPDVDGITLLKEFTKAGHSSPVVMISGHGTVETAVEATRLGAFDFVEKPLSMGKLLSTVERAIAEMRKPKSESAARAAVEPVGHSELMRTLRERAAKVAEQRDTVLIYGEPGAGKSLFARYIHNLSACARGPFLSVNLASLETEEIHKLLFGSHTGAEDVPQNAFVQARGGTLFINNISVAELSVQSRLVEMLTQEENDISLRRGVELPRIIVATSEDVRPLVDVGQFRRDLFYKLNETPLWIPPLRDHREDVPELLSYFVDLAMSENQLPYRKFSFAAQNWLRNYSWPGNALEMKNLVKSLLVLGNESDIEVDEVKATLGHNFSSEAPSAGGDLQQGFELPLREARERFEKAYLEFHLRAANGNVGVVARKAGMERTHLYRKFRALGIDPKNIRQD